MINELILTRPDDWHVHLRDGEQLARTVADIAPMARAIVMPNLSPPVKTAKDALAYRERILAARVPEQDFSPLMTLYLTDNTTPADIAGTESHSSIVACKLYPAGATTNSDSGVTNIENIYPALEEMEKRGILLLLHGEVTDPAIDVFDRERIFIEKNLGKILDRFPNLKVVLEHITTKDAVEFVSEDRPNLAATITAHHLLFNRNHMLVGRIRPHFYCLPILKRSRDQEALVKAATSGHPRFFLGTDSAPHEIGNKESSCGCAGSYTSNVALEMYASVFEECDKLENLEGFASFFGPDFYGLPRNTSKVKLVRQANPVPKTLGYGTGVVVPLMGGMTLEWTCKELD